MIKIDVPKEDIAVRVNNIELIPRKSGIYLLYGEDKNLLYIGVLPTKSAKHTLSKFRHKKSRLFLR